MYEINFFLSDDVAMSVPEALAPPHFVHVYLSFVCLTMLTTYQHTALTHSEATPSVQSGHAHLLASSRYLPSQLLSNLRRVLSCQCPRCDSPWTSIHPC